MMDFVFSGVLLWGGLTALLLSYGLKAVFSGNNRPKQPVDIPTANTLPSWTPRLFHNLWFAVNAAKILEYGRQKFRNGAFQIIRNSGNTVVLPPSLLEELATLPPAVASSHRTIEHDLMGRYTGLHMMVESRIHHTVLQRKLTPRLDGLAPAIEGELNSALETAFENVTDSDWTVFEPHPTLNYISARLSSYALVGPTYCRDPSWLDLAVNYPKNLTQTVVLLRLFPVWAQPAVARLLPSFWRCRHLIRSGQKLLGPYIRELLDKHDRGLWRPSTDPEDSNVLHWLVDMAKDKDRNPDTIGHIEVFMTMAAIHTTLQSMVNVFYDLVETGPELTNELLAEIEEVAASSEAWTPHSYEKLHKMDSVFRESQRASPPMIMAMKRLFLEPYTFSNGFHAAKGTFVCMETCEMEEVPGQYPKPPVFDGLRSYRAALEIQTKENTSDYPRDWLFSSPSRDILSFGFGKGACPGRFIASRFLKILYVKLLTEYEFKYMEGDGPASKIMAYEFYFRSPGQKLLVRRKKEAKSPF